MTESPAISLFVKLKYWDVYRFNIIFMAMSLRKTLYFWSFVAVLFLASALFAFFRPGNVPDWVVIMQNADPLLWVLALPLVSFLMTLTAARRVLRQPRVKEGVRYRFSEAGVHVETSVSTADLLWSGVQRVRETRSMFMVFTGRANAFALPKWCFENAQGVSTLRELFRAQVKTTRLRSD
jgi:hypothetical protein